MIINPHIAAKINQLERLQPSTIVGISAGELLHLLRLGVTALNNAHNELAAAYDENASLHAADRSGIDA